MPRRPVLLLPLLLALALASPLPAGDSPPAPVEAVSLLGEALRRPVLDDGFQRRQETLLHEAIARLTADARDLEALLWVGRRTAYLGRYREAVAVYSRGIRSHPHDPRLYRHRGHRRITLRQLGAAEEDLERAVELMAGAPDEVEPDGLPNDRGLPTSTLKFNVWYHLGLARYLQGDLGGALEAYRHCLDVAKSPDSRVAASYWLVLTLRGLGKEDEARAVLGEIDPAMDIIENQDYHRLLLAFRGDRSLPELIAAAREAGGVGLPTVAYGAAAWHRLEGRPEEAQRLLQEAVDTGSWAAFGAIAAEAELSRGPTGNHGS